MTYSTIESNGRMSRKTLSTQIDRLDGILDGLREALSQSVAMAVKEAVSSVVREAVEAAVKEVLSNPALLKAALAHHTQPAAQTQPATQKVKGRTLWEAMGAGWSWLRTKVTEKASEVKKSLGVAWAANRRSRGRTTHSLVPASPCGFPSRRFCFSGPHLPLT